MPFELPERVGLCAGCRHAQRVRTPRSAFWLCGKSRTDATYERYPRLPVLACPGFEPGEPVGPETAKPEEGGGPQN